MKSLLKIEELLMFIFSFYVFTNLEYEWYWFFVFLLAPDIGFLGYVVNPKIGAFTYNVMHHKGIAIMVILLGMYLNLSLLLATGIVLFGHSSMDRIFGYGLKYNDDFKHTHLGWIGKK